MNQTNREIINQLTRQAQRLFVMITIPDGSYSADELAKNNRNGNALWVIPEEYEEAFERSFHAAAGSFACDIINKRVFEFLAKFERLEKLAGNTIFVRKSKASTIGEVKFYVSPEATYLAKCVSTYKDRPHIHNIMLDSRNGRLVTTNGFTLDIVNVYNLKGFEYFINFDKTDGMIPISPKQMKALVGDSFAEIEETELGHQRVVFRDEQWKRFFAPEPEGVFPNYQRILNDQLCLSDRVMLSDDSLKAIIRMCKPAKKESHVLAIETFAESRQASAILVNRDTKKEEQCLDIVLTETPSEGRYVAIDAFQVKIRAKVLTRSMWIHHNSVHMLVWDTIQGMAGIMPIHWRSDSFGNPYKAWHNKNEATVSIDGRHEAFVRHEQNREQVAQNEAEAWLDLAFSSLDRAISEIDYLRDWLDLQETLAKAKRLADKLGIPLGHQIASTDDLPSPSCNTSAEQVPSVGSSPEHGAPPAYDAFPDSVCVDVGDGRIRIPRISSGSDVASCTPLVGSDESALLVGDDEFSLLVAGSEFSVMADVASHVVADVVAIKDVMACANAPP